MTTPRPEHEPTEPGGHAPLNNGPNVDQPGHFTRAESIYFEVAGLSPADRASRIANLCAGDDGLRATVMALLAAADRVGGFLEEPVLGRAFDQLTTESRALEDAAHDHLVGATLGPFRLDKRIDSGGMGTVYLASRADLQFTQRVAIKVVKRGMDSAEVLHRFNQERRTLAQLDHPNIARLLDAGVTPDGRPYIVMEFVDGLPIDKAADAARLSINQRLALFRLVADAVHAAHQSLVIHRDLKPGNILVSPSGIPKLLDFGIAKLLSGQQGAAVTADTDRRLTPEYASPEQVAGEPITTASDVYALGVILYELLAGSRPYAFTTRSSQEVRRLVCDTVPPPPSMAIARSAPRARSATATTPAPTQQHEPETAHTGATADHPRTHRVSSTRLRNQLRGDLDTIVMTALRKEPHRRYASAEQLSADIGRYLAGMPVWARRDTFWYRASKFTRRHAGAVAACVVAVTLLAVGLVVRTQQRNTIATQRDQLALANAQLSASRTFLSGIISGAQTTARGPSATLGEVLADATTLLRTNPPADPNTRAAAQHAAGSALMTLGQPELARPLLEAAHAVLATLPPLDEQRLAAEFDLAQLNYYEGRAAQAEAPLRALLDTVSARDGAAPSALQGDIFSALGAVVRISGGPSRQDEALQLATSALTVRTAVHGPRSLPAAESHNNIATIHLGAGRTEQARSHYATALEVRTALLRPGHPLIVATQANLGLATLRAGDARAAVELLTAAADTWQTAHGPDHPGYATVLTSLGQAHRAQGNTDDSARALQRALEWQLSRTPALPPAQVLSTRINLALTTASTAEPGPAIIALEAVRADSAFGAVSPGLAKLALTALANAYDKAGRPEEANAVRELPLMK